MNPPTNPNISVNIIAHTPKKTPKPVRRGPELEAISDMMAVEDMAIMIPIMKPITALTAPSITANGMQVLPLLFSLPFRYTYKLLFPFLLRREV